MGLALSWCSCGEVSDKFRSRAKVRKGGVAHGQEAALKPYSWGRADLTSGNSQVNFISIVILGPSTTTETETIAKYEIMDGAPVKGKLIS